MAACGWRRPGWAAARTPASLRPRSGRRSGSRRRWRPGPAGRPGRSRPRISSSPETRCRGAAFAIRPGAWAPSASSSAWGAQVVNETTRATTATPTIVAVTRMSLACQAVSQAAQRPDRRGHGQQDQARDDIPLQYHATDSGEGDGGAGPGQRGTLAGQAGTGGRVTARLTGGAGLAGGAGLVAGGHQRSAETRTTTAAATAITAMITAMISGMTDRGSGRP